MANLEETARELQALGYRQVSRPGQDFVGIVEPTYAMPQPGQLHPQTPVLAFAIESVPVAYPVDRLSQHLTINDNSPSGVPFAVAYCPQTGKSAVLSRQVRQDLVLTLEASGGMLGQSQVLFDRETMSFWDVGSGQAVAGPLRGQALVNPEGTDVLPWLVLTSWGEMVRLYPETQLWTGGTALPPPGFEKRAFRPPKRNPVDWGKTIAAGASAGIPALIPGAGFAKEFVEQVSNAEVPAQEKILAGAAEAIKDLLLPGMGKHLDPRVIAIQLLNQIQSINRKSPEEAYLESITRHGAHEEPYDAKLFGKYLVWETVGAGPRWDASHPPHFLEVPADLPGSGRRRKSGARANPDGLRDRAQETLEYIRKYLRRRYLAYLGSGSSVRVAMARAFGDALVAFGEPTLEACKRKKKGRLGNAVVGRTPRLYRIRFPGGKKSMPWPRLSHAQAHARAWKAAHPRDMLVFEALNGTRYKPVRAKRRRK